MNEPCHPAGHRPQDESCESCLDVRLLHAMAPLQSQTISTTRSCSARQVSPGGIWPCAGLPSSVNHDHQASEGLPLLVEKTLSLQGSMSASSATAPSRSPMLIVCQISIPQQANEQHGLVPSYRERQCSAYIQASRILHSHSLYADSCPRLWLQRFETKNALVPARFVPTKTYPCGSNRYRKAARALPINSGRMFLQSPEARVVWDCNTMLSNNWLYKQ